MKIFQYSKNTCRRTLSLMSANKRRLALLNAFYESAPVSVLKKIEPLMPVPKFDYTWKIMLDDKQLYFTYCKGEPRNVYHFPLSYKKNDFGIRLLEKIIHKAVSDDKVYFDLGANFGLRSLFYMSKGRQCHLFEPNSVCNTSTRRLIAQNGLSNVTLISKAVGPTSGNIKFYRSKSTYLSSVNPEYPNSCGDYLDETTIEMTSVDDYVSSKNLHNKVGIMKIDVEGFELEACEGASKLLANSELVIIIEVTTNQQKRLQLYQLFQTMGYTVYAIKPHTARLVLSESPDTFEDEYFDFLCTNNNAVKAILTSYLR